ITSGHFQHLIVQPEQLKSFKGHLPRLARPLNDPNFVKTIARVHVDEADFIYTAGLPLYGLPAAVFLTGLGQHAVQRSCCS
ncbi:hypothetical protein B0H14DRAFT_2178101, partial [Mycena olivaceomarginata]